MLLLELLCKYMLVKNVFILYVISLVLSYVMFLLQTMVLNSTSVSLTFGILFVLTVLYIQYAIPFILLVIGFTRNKALFIHGFYVVVYFFLLIVTFLILQNPLNDLEYQFRITSSNPTIDFFAKDITVIFLITSMSFGVYGIYRYVLNQFVEKK